MQLAINMIFRYFIVVFNKFSLNFNSCVPWKNYTIPTGSWNGAYCFVYWLKYIKYIYFNKLIKI